MRPILNILIYFQILQLKRKIECKQVEYITNAGEALKLFDKVWKTARRYISHVLQYT